MQAESKKGDVGDSDMSGKEIARAPAKLPRGGMYEFVANLYADVVESLLGYAPNLTSVQQMPESSSSPAAYGTILPSGPLFLIVIGSLVRSLSRFGALLCGLLLGCMLLTEAGAPSWLRFRESMMLGYRNDTGR